MAIATPNQTAMTTAKVFYERFIAVFGAPRRIISDQGAAFTSKVLQALCDVFGVSRTFTTSYHPMGNGQVERWNQTMLRMIGKLEDTKKYSWKEHLSEITQAYNSTRSSVTGYSPHYLMFGRRPRLPVDVQFPTIRNCDIKTQMPEYVAALQDRFKLAFNEARVQSNNEAVRHKRYYDKHTCSTKLQPGDTVLLKIDKVTGRRKIQDRWSDVNYEVVENLAPDSPLYRIRDSNGDIRVVHRNKLLCIATMPQEPCPNLSTFPTDVTVEKIRCEELPVTGEIVYEREESNVATPARQTSQLENPASDSLLVQAFGNLIQEAPLEQT